MNQNLAVIPADYAAWLAEIKTRATAACVSVRRYCECGIDRPTGRLAGTFWSGRRRQGWGSKVIERLARDLREAFPEMKGFSSSNVKYMRYFAEHRSPDLPIWSAAC